jgi:hypothetical protein
MYEIIGLPPGDFPDDIDTFYEDPRLLKSDLWELRHRFPNTTFQFLREGVIGDEASLDEDIRRFEIHLTIRDADRLPTGYRRGWGTDQNDFAASGDGPIRVWRPPNPED